MAYLSGKVRASAQQQVFSASSGFLKSQAVDIGDRVKKGDVLAVINAPLAEIEVKQAAAAVQLAKGQVQEAKANLKTAEMEFRTA